MDQLSTLFQVWSLSRIVARILDEALADAGLTAGDFALYSLIDALGPLTPTRISEISGMPVTTVSDRLQEIEARGHLTRRENAADRRSILVSLSESGSQVRREAQPAFARVLTRTLADLGADRDLVAWALARLDAALRRAAGLEPGPLQPSERRRSPHTLEYTGPPLSTAQATETRVFVDWIRARDARR